MSIEADFINTIRDNPEDQNLPLIYADWLDEAGDSRGELIRLQRQLEQTELASPARQDLRSAIYSLSHAHHSNWVAPLRRRAIGWHEARLRSGLVDNVSLSPAAFLKHAQSGLFEEMPYLTGVALEGSGRSLEAALSSPLLAKLTSLRIKVLGLFEPTNLIRHLVDNPHTRSLATLSLSENRFGDQAIAELLQSAALPWLRELNLRNNALTARIAEPLAESPLLPGLERLSLGSRWDMGANQLEDIGVRRLARCGKSLRLRWLDLSANNLSDSSAWDLSNSDCFDKMECLYLAGNTFGRASRNALEARFGNRVMHARSDSECVTG